jgi:nucleotide-binding universal stress UspA family protein
VYAIDAVLYQFVQRGSIREPDLRACDHESAMASVTDIGRNDAPAAPSFGRRRPILLGTLSVRVDARAERIALDSALETGSQLILANIMRLRPYPLTAVLAPEYSTLPHEEDLEAVRASAARAASLGIRTELLRISSPRPVKALLELVRDREPGLLVFGPDRSLLPARRYRAAARAVRRDAPCLVWVGD